MAEIQGDACKTIISWHEPPRNGCWEKEGRPLTEEKIKIDTLLYVLLATHLSFLRTTGQPFGRLRNFIARTQYVFTIVVFNALILNAHLLPRWSMSLRSDSRKFE